MSIIEQPGFLFLAGCHDGDLEQGQGSRGIREGGKCLLRESEEPVLGFTGEFERP